MLVYAFVLLPFIILHHSFWTHDISLWHIHRWGWSFLENIVFPLFHCHLICHQQMAGHSQKLKKHSRTCLSRNRPKKLSKTSNFEKTDRCRSFKHFVFITPVAYWQYICKDEHTLAIRGAPKVTSFYTHFLQHGRNSTQYEYESALFFKRIKFACFCTAFQ